MKMSETWSILSPNRTRSPARSQVYTNQCSKTGTVLSLEVREHSLSCSRHFLGANIRYSLVTALHCTSFLSRHFSSFTVQQRHLFVDIFKILDSYWATRLCPAYWRLLIGRQIVNIAKGSHPSIWLGKFKSRLHSKTLISQNTNIYILVLLKKRFGEFFLHSLSKIN